MITISARPGISCWQSTLSKRKDRTRSCCGELRTSQRNLEDPFPSGAGSLGSPPFSTRGTGDHGRPGAGRVGALWLGVWAAGPHSLLEGPRGRSRLCQGVLKAGLGSAGNGGGVPEVGPLLCGGWGVQVAGPGLCWWGGGWSWRQVPGSAGGLRGRSRALLSPPAAAAVPRRGWAPSEGFLSGAQPSRGCVGLSTVGFQEFPSGGKSVLKGNS